MACIFGKSICETCGNEFNWRRHDSQPPARFCKRSCTNKKFGVDGNKNRIFWSIATKEEKKERIINFYQSKVIKKTGCWEWKGSLDKDGYPQICAGHTKAKGHRVSYEIHKGEILDGLHVCHTCDNPTCTNPEHLWLGTKKDNEIDKKKKNRVSKGENRWNSKLKDSNIVEIRYKLSIGVSGSRLAKDYNVTNMVISSIKNGKTWKHVKD